MPRSKKTKRPWGSYAVLSIGNGFKVKLVEVAPKKRLSLQKHTYRSEHWVVVQGAAKITNGRNTIYLDKNQSTYIPTKGVHRLENPSNKPLRIVEVQCGKVLKESDILRLSDDHGRK